MGSEQGSGPAEYVEGWGGQHGGEADEGGQANAACCAGQDADGAGLIFGRRVEVGLSVFSSGISCYRV